jgi:hypothetical protein
MGYPKTHDRNWKVSPAQQRTRPPLFFLEFFPFYLYSLGQKKHIVYDSKIVQQHAILLESACVPENVDTQ